MKPLPSLLCGSTPPSLLWQQPIPAPSTAEGSASYPPPYPASGVDRIVTHTGVVHESMGVRGGACARVCVLVKIHSSYVPDWEDVSVSGRLLFTLHACRHTCAWLCTHVDGLRHEHTSIHTGMLKGFICNSEINNSK